MLPQGPHGEAGRWGQVGRMAVLKAGRKAGVGSMLLRSLEDLKLVSSAQVPHSGPPGGVPGVVYWLTPAGLEHVAELKKQGRLKAAKRGSK